MQLTHLAIAAFLNLAALGSAKAVCGQPPNICDYGKPLWVKCPNNVNECKTNVCQGATGHHCCKGDGGTIQEFCVPTK
ncbi:hypothetical protein FKW77_009847 [Venturia effusa]|uniref:Uncharacterized protein n=1 Tax=Venturia effusa TaxID=50376 RepID=A0A517L246_9PEZI|nr:hypothetical protein FKW77_009847 [Venturia effusa]